MFFSFFGRTHPLMKYFIRLALAAFALLLFMVRNAFAEKLNKQTIHLASEKPFDPFQLLFIADIHRRTIKADLIDFPIDLIVIGGDLVEKGVPLKRVAENIKNLTAIAPVYFVWGNNDREVGEEFLRSIFEETGVTIIENDAILLKNSNNPCWFSAVDDQSKEVQKALKKCRDKDAIVFIAHNPEVFPSLKNVPVQVDLMLAGHYHGGQIRFGKFGIYPLGSFSTVDGVPTLISNGYGTTLVPFRFGAKPECHIIDLHFQK